MVLEKLTLGQKLSLLRKEKKLSQSALAKELGVGASSICRWENDQKHPEKANLLIISKYFNKPLNYFDSDSSTTSYKNMKLKVISGLLNDKLVFLSDDDGFIYEEISLSQIKDDFLFKSNADIQKLFFIWIDKQDKYIVKRCTEYEGGAMYLVYEDYGLKAMDLSDRKENGQSSNFRVVGKLLKLIRELD